MSSFNPVKKHMHSAGAKPQTHADRKRREKAGRVKHKKPYTEQL